MKIYLAARYSRRKELCKYRKALEFAGCYVTSRWLDGDHQIDDTGTPIGEHGEALIENGSVKAAMHLRERFALEDFLDVARADALIAFTETPRAKASRGGRHVELGIALGLAKRVLIVGPRENIFCWLPRVEVFEHFDACLTAVRKVG